ncbi:MAG TPA: iron ABC transporter permease [Phycisphaerae bacterium]|nr:iron ABC transporter permease [Phycisphaerae bacterium]
MTTHSPRRFTLALAACGALIIVLLILSPGIGSQYRAVGFRDAWSSFFKGERESSSYWIGFRHRLPRSVLALQIGITLALCGAVFQTLFRNALATPYTLGVSSGGSLGALIAIRLGLSASVCGVSAISGCAFLGAIAVILIVFMLARSKRGLSTNELLLAGVTMGLFCSAMMMLVTYLSNARQTFEIIGWMMGSLDPIGDTGSSLSWPLLVVAWLILLGSSRALNQYMLGDELAASRGVHVERLILVCVLIASIATAAVVAMCGPIGFVGLVVPHMAALVVGRDCRILLPAGAMLGGVFLIICDWLSQLIMVWAGRLTGRDLSGVVLPIGVVTAVVGVPIFLTLLRRRAT